VVAIMIGRFIYAFCSRAVFVLSGGRARLRHVQIGRSSLDEAYVLEGRAGGERVILHPGDRVVDGVRVTARPRASGARPLP
jgi:hypothetical protein